MDKATDSASTVSPPQASRLTRDAAKGGSLADSEEVYNESRAWQGVRTRAEEYMHDHLESRNSDYHRLVTRHHAQEAEINSLNYALGGARESARTSGTWATIIGGVSAVTAAVIPILSFWISSIKEKVSIEMLSIFGGVLAGLVPLTLWLIGRKYKRSP